VPLAIVRVIVDPLMPPSAVLGKETVDRELDGVVDGGGGLATELE